MIRRRLRRHRLLAFAVACATVAIVLALLAADVAAWQRTVARDDLKFRAQPTHRALWDPSTSLPGDPASALVGTSSTIKWRRALQYFWYSRIGSNPEIRMDSPTLRAATQDKLLAQVSSAPTPAERSAAANLLGVLVVTTPAVGNDSSVITQLLKRATGYFQQAIELDPKNTAAKQNLELVLRITQPGRGRLGQDARSGYGFGRGQGAVATGSGY
jgi:hypothetical protein